MASNSLIAADGVKAEPLTFTEWFEFEKSHGNPVDAIHAWAAGAKEMLDELVRCQIIDGHLAKQAREITQSISMPSVL